MTLADRSLVSIIQAFDGFDQGFSPAFVKDLCPRDGDHAEQGARLIADDAFRWVKRFNETNPISKETMTKCKKW